MTKKYGRVALGGYLPGLPRIRTCPIKAYGSSGNGLRYVRYTEWTTVARGNGNRSKRLVKPGHEREPLR